jgi:hypothetical protein
VKRWRGGIEGERKKGRERRGEIKEGEIEGFPQISSFKPTPLCEMR